MQSDVVLIGGGIMSATLGALLKRLDPALTVQLFELGDRFAAESSDGWNNAGTGHAGICELSYTPDRDETGEVDVSKAVSIFAEFESSLQFWASAVRDGMVYTPSEFINPVPHVSFVAGATGVDFLRSRHRRLAGHHFFSSMQFTDDPVQVASWCPLLMDGRSDAPVAATKMDAGTDINFGALTRKLIAWLGSQPGCAAHTGHRVVGLDRTGDGWDVTVRDESTGDTSTTSAKFVFVGAGGGSLPLLQKSGIPEAKTYGGFPIGGQWLVCDRPEIVSRHDAKVYGQALGAAPTMAVPHLDTRIIDGKKSLLFGPFGSWTTKFLHHGGSRADLPASVRRDNLWPLIKTGADNLPLVGYLIGQGLQSMENRLDELRNFFPAAKLADWRLIDAGIRVQAIKSVQGSARIVHFGTEVITDQDRTISALLGASPGASVSVHVMLEVIRECHPHLLQGDALERLKRLIPTFDRDNPSPAEAERFNESHTRAWTGLGLDR